MTARGMAPAAGALLWASVAAAQATGTDSTSGPRQNALPPGAARELEELEQSLAAPAAGAPAPTAPADAAERAAASDEGSAPGDEVVVHAARVRRAPGSLHVVGPEVLERFKYDDPNATLQLVPGVYVRHEDGFGLRPNIGIRGAISDRSKKVALLEDGVLFAPAPYSAPAAYYFPLIGRMSSVEVIKGPSAVEYGPQTVGGAVDLHTLPIPAAFGGFVDVAGGQYGFGKLHAAVGSADRDTGFLIEGIHLESTGFKDLPGGEGTGFHRNELMFKGDHRFGFSEGDRSQRLSLKLTYSDESSNETYLGLTDADFERDPRRRYGASRGDKMGWHRLSGVLSHEAQLSSAVSLRTTAYRHDLDRSWNKVNHFATAALFEVVSEPDTARNAPFVDILEGSADAVEPEQLLFIGPNQRRYVSQGVQSELSLSARTGDIQHEVVVGARLHHDAVRRRHSETAYEIRGGEPGSSVGAPVLTTLNRADTLAVSAHASDELRWRDLTLTPGVRLEVMSSRFVERMNPSAADGERTVTVLLAGLGAHYALSPSFGVLAGAHRGMSPPAPGTGDSVDPEISLNYEVGARYLSGFRRLELIGYFSDYQNLTNICTLSGGCAEENLDVQFDAGRARIYGAEALVEESILTPWFRVPVSLSYTLTRTEFLETFQSQDSIFGDVEAGDEMPYVPEHQGRASVGVVGDVLGGYVAATYTGRMRERSGAGPLDRTLATDELLSVDVGLSAEPWGWLSLYANLRNALDAQVIASRRPYGARPNPPRWLQVGAKVSFE